ncbi:PAS domain-containing hybrid sensor histidine kinase/response regulator [Tianweitania sediminis]|uniref:histidine kinase n=1 Tax=Tianweitania sediminis TaxID=1502156 RepID=A0A8J7RHS2_9HYPH|nr:PAS domain-containing hybrid sensor histidine kinase/response regulator [Tianweitania sediminis]MBP0438671.1 response regulator [Tianweitania sediminis]
MAGEALILAPRGRDAEVASRLLSAAGIGSIVCASYRDLVERLTDDACFAVITEESLRGEDLDHLRSAMAEQAPWSDFQFIVLTASGALPERTRSATKLSEVLRNVSFLERPFHPTSFTSLARTAKKGRDRQYEARARMEELHESRNRLNTALSAGRLGAWELDLASMTLTTTATCKAIFGYAPDEPFAYADLLARIHPQDLPRMRAAVEESLRRGIDYLIEYRTIWRDGSEHWAAIQARVLNHGDPGAQMVGVSADVTARRKAETDIQRLNETLEARVVERTAELEAAHRTVLSEITQREKAESLLRQSQKVEMIGQLTGGVAHDFNNLLMAVLGNLDLLRKNLPEEPKIQRLIDGAMQGAKRGAALTQRLLAFARRQELSVEPVNVSELVRQMTDLIDKSTGANIEWQLRLSDEVPLALIDPNQVELALLNLVVNSRDAMPEGGVLTISVESAIVAEEGELPAGEYVRLTVTDTGQGMDLDTLKKATEPFYSTKELGKGTGLGLSMVHGLAQQLSGMLRLTSTPGRGTTAELWLPASAGQEASIRPAELVDPGPDQPLLATILTVDDDPLIAMSTVDMLEDLGHEVIEANSAAQALEIIKSGRRIDVLMTDFSMPKMNGAQLAEAALQIVPDLRILLATGYAELPPGYSLDLPRLSKPYQQADLQREIERLIRR